MTMNIHQKLGKIQRELVVPKSNFNSFGKYAYRSAEDILEAVTPLLGKYNVTLRIEDEIVLIGDRYYLKATAIITDEESEKEVSTTAYAREPQSKKGMDDSQLTGSTSSYARKYALNGLFAIDDSKDADTMDNRQQGQTRPPQQRTTKADSNKFSVISAEQVHRLWTIASQKEVPHEKAVALIKKYGYESSKDITTADYNKIVSELGLLGE